MHYYFLASRLPPLAIGEVPEITWEEFLFLLDANLTPSDRYWVNLLRFYFDLENIRHFWLEEELDPLGRLNALELEEALLTGEGFPEYVYTYLEQYPEQEDRLKNFSWLIASFYRENLRNAPQFLLDYMKMERSLRLVLVAFRAKRMGRDLATELQFEDPEEDLIAQLMAQKDAKEFDPQRNSLSSK